MCPVLVGNLRNGHLACAFARAAAGTSGVATGHGHAAGIPVLRSGLRQNDTAPSLTDWGKIGQLLALWVAHGPDSPVFPYGALATSATRGRVTPIGLSVSRSPLPE